MSVNWIATNPKPNVKNQANQAPMPDAEFEEFIRLLIHNKRNYEEQLELLLKAKGFFSAEQAGNLIQTFPRPKDKLKAVMILEPKLVSITCQQARNILAAFFIPEDKLEALEYVKRAVNDANTQEGLDYIVSCFTFEDHKLVAAQIINSIVPKRGLQVAAGGHLGYAPCGALYTNAPPNLPHMYGPVVDQIRNLPNHRQPVNSNEAGATRNFLPAGSIYANNLSENTVFAVDNHSRGALDRRGEYLNPDKVRATYA